MRGGGGGGGARLIGHLLLLIMSIENWTEWLSNISSPLDLFIFARFVWVLKIGSKKLTHVVGV